MLLQSLRTWTVTGRPTMIRGEFIHRDYWYWIKHRICTARLLVWVMTRAVCDQCGCVLTCILNHTHLTCTPRYLFLSNRVLTTVSIACIALFLPKNVCSLHTWLSSFDTQYYIHVFYLDLHVYLYIHLHIICVHTTYTRSHTYISHKLGCQRYLLHLSCWL